MKKFSLPLTVFSLICFALLGWILVSYGQQSDKKTQEKAGAFVQTQADSFDYQGEEGKDALTLLKEKTQVEDKDGFVTSINGRKADDNKREFWAFYVNGEQAEVGAGTYLTKDGDKIEWKIENY